MRHTVADRTILLTAALLNAAWVSNAQPSGYEFNDSHFHLTNYIQEGTDIHRFLEMMGNSVGRVAIFGIPLQQQWSYRVDAKNAPTYYLNSDAPLYYYSFTDAWIAMAYKALPEEQRGRLDPMITGFNPTDMYAADHIRRVLKTFPGVFSGIGEFTIHKEFVSAKIAGEVASLQDPALDRILDLAAEVGLVVLIHNDIDVPFAKEGSTPAYLDQMKAVLKRHPNTTIIWAHTGVGRVVRPIKDHAANLEAILGDIAFNHVYFDISWDEVAKYIVSSPAATKITTDLMERYPNRFLFGTDEVAPTSQSNYLRVFKRYSPLWKLLTPPTSEKVRKTNYEHIFDEARHRVRTWESSHAEAVGPDTMFQVSLSCTPKRRLEVQSAITSAEPEQSNARAGTILVVEDDEEFIRLAVSKALRKRGFSVMKTSDGSAANGSDSHGQGRH